LTIFTFKAYICGYIPRKRKMNIKYRLPRRNFCVNSTRIIDAALTNKKQTNKFLFSSITNLATKMVSVEK